MSYQNSFSFSYFSLSSENFQNLQFAWLLCCRFAGFPAVFIWSIIGVVLFLVFAVILFMGEMFTLPLYAQISLFVLSNLLLFFIGPVPSAKRKVMTKKQYTNKRFLSSLILLVYTILYFALQNVPHLCRFLEHHFTNYTINLCQVDTERRNIWKRLTNHSCTSLVPCASLWADSFFIMDLVCCSLENQTSKKNKNQKTTSETYLVSIVVFLSKELFEF